MAASSIEHGDTPMIILSLLSTWIFSSFSFADLPRVNPFCLAAVDSFELEGKLEIDPAEVQTILRSLISETNDPRLELPEVPRRFSYQSGAPRKAQTAAAALDEILQDLESSRPTRHVLYFQGEEAILGFYARYKNLARFIAAQQTSFEPELWEKIYRAVIGKLGALWSAKKSMIFGGTAVSAGLLSRYTLGIDEVTEIGTVIIGLVQSAIGALVTYGPTRGANAWSVISNAALTQNDRPVFPDYSPSEVFQFYNPGEWQFNKSLFTEPTEAVGSRQSPMALLNAPPGVTAKHVRRYALSGRPEFMAITSQVATKSVLESLIYVDQQGGKHFLLFVKPL